MRNTFLSNGTAHQRLRMHMPLSREASGQYFEHLYRIASSLTDFGILKAAGFLDPAASIEKHAFDEDALALVFGSFVLSLLGSRLQRSMWLLSAWPMKMCQLLEPGVDKQRLIDEFHRDYTVFVELSSLQQKPASLQKLLDRSCFNLVAAKQWCAACEEFAWQYNDELSSLARTWFGGVLCSQIVEDSFAQMKNHRQVRGSRRLRKPQASMGVALTSGVMDRRHRYTTVPSDVPIFRRTLRLAKESFGGAYLPASSMDLSGIASGKSKAEWFSPKADDIGGPAADLSVLRSLWMQGPRVLGEPRGPGSRMGIPFRFMLYSCARPTHRKRRRW